MADISKITLPSGTTYNLKDPKDGADVEDLIQRLLALKKKLIKYGIDESIKNKSGWRV